MSRIDNIERDVHLLESYAGMTHKMNDNQGRPKLDQAIERILLDYKRILKENEELKALDLSNSKMIANMSTRHFHDREKIRNSIPKQKIKDKIERIQEEGYWLFTTDRDSDKCVEILQELLGGNNE